MRFDANGGKERSSLQFLFVCVECRKFHLYLHIMRFSTVIRHFAGLFYPELCEACGDSLSVHEKVLCTSCIYHLPRTNYWKEAGNPMERLFWGKIRLEHACALFFFAKGSRFRKLLHKLKYNGKKEIGIALGRRLGMELKAAPFYQAIDLIIPIPLHQKKLRKRGYNQSEQIAAGMAATTGWKLDAESVTRNLYTETQTNKSRMERWENVSEVFVVKYPERIKGKHVLLVDDVITTGSTIEACAARLLEVEGCSVSVATLACVK